MKKIMITDCDHKDIVPETLVFEKAGFAFEMVQCKTREDVIEKCKGAVALINQYVPLDRTVFKALPTVKFIVRYGVGVDNINVKDATEFGVQVCNVPDYGVNEVADHALALMIENTRKVIKMNAQVKAGGWEYAQAIPIRRPAMQTVGIIGLGRIGTAFANRVRAMGFNILGFDVAYGSKNRIFPDFVKFVSFDELLSRSDIVSIHCSLNETTADLFNAEAFGKMKKGSILINVSRGGIVDEKALFEAVSSGHLGGAGIDVTKCEPLQADHPFRTCKNIIVTPHMAWYSEDSAEELKRKCAEECVLFMAGKPLRYQINNVQ
jgi:D-3-phosphoglycerate dehydrogenase